ncbi:Hsp70 family protein [Cysteiniphilum sp. 6C5]|uniref:Hsp70 family protein n=1 Tax=unclassified Cysteiniphilum TaxID=2610889 RepID=UPI003F84F945
MKETIIGIDLGTTNSEVGVLINGQTTLFSDEQGNQVIPSVVHFTEDKKTLVGHAAKNMSGLYPEQTIHSIKRKMGSDESIVILGESYTPTEISAMILKELKKIAENKLGYAVNKAVITVPAYFNDVQRQATKQAGDIAGLEVVRIINEPTAASIAYEGDHKVAQTMLVYDLGGGTFDVSVIEVKDGLIEVISSTGNNHLGGDDFDACLLEILKNKIQERYEIDVEGDSKAMRRLKMAAENAKIALSEDAFTHIREDYFAEDSEGNAVHLDIEISQGEYEDQIEHLVDKTLKSVHQALNEANITTSDIHNVLLVGGSTRTPMIRQSLKALFERAPRIDLHPDLCVAMGASIQAGVIAGEKQTRTLIDISPYAFGTTTLDGNLEESYHILIEKNSPLPAHKSEVYYKLHQKQEKVKMDVYQGDNSDYKKNKHLGDFWLEFSKNHDNMEIICDFKLDLNGILTVSATEKSTGKTSSITVDYASETQKQSLAEAKEKLAQLNQETTEQSDNLEIENFIKEIQSKLSLFSQEDQEGAEELLDNLNYAIAQNDEDEINSLKEALSDLVYYLESEI